MNAHLADRINTIHPPPPAGLQLDLFATIITLEQIRAALDNGNELEALRITRFELLHDTLPRLTAHITDQTWQWSVRHASDIPGGETAWLGYINAALQRIRVRPPRRGLFNRGARNG